MLTIDIGTLERLDKPDANYCAVDMRGNANAETVPAVLSPSAYWQEQSRIAIAHADMLRQALTLVRDALVSGDVAGARDFAEGALAADSRATARAQSGEVAK